MAEYSLLLGVRLKDVPPGTGTHQDILAKYRISVLTFPPVARSRQNR
jgi:hypothetical protein